MTHTYDDEQVAMNGIYPSTPEKETPTPKTVEEVAREINNGLASMLIAWIAIELIFGADDFIYWVANLIA